MTEVRFQYDEAARKWQVLVTGVSGKIEAQQAFAAIIMTCDPINPGLQHHAQVKQTSEGYYITPAV